MHRESFLLSLEGLPLKQSGQGFRLLWKVLPTWIGKERSLQTSRRKGFRGSLYPLPS